MNQYTLWSYQKEKRTKKQQKAFKRKNNWKLPKSAEENGYTDSWSLKDSKWDEYKEVYTETQHT